ncbi:MAG: hypothetical protein QOF44_3343, partial [Streptomyces sp.]|nr:hypothetical protein [Streptomyces sp.]
MTERAEAAHPAGITADPVVGAGPPVPPATGAGRRLPTGEGAVRRLVAALPLTAV